MLRLSLINPERSTWFNGGLLFILTILSAGLARADSSINEEINQRLNTGQSQSAYELANAHRNEMEGDPEFDLLYGTAALNSGHLSEGVLALERVVALQPANVKARLELAKGYYLIGDNVRSRQQFDQLKALANNDQDKQYIQAYLTAIRQRELRYQSTASGYVQLGVGYDTNINTGPSSDLADNLLPFHLGPDATDKRDGFGELAVGGQFDHPMTRRVGVYGEANGRLRKYRDQNTYDNDLLNAQLGAKWTYKNYLLKASLLAQQYRVYNDIYRNMYGTTLEALNSFSPQYTAGLALNYLSLIYPNQKLRDSTQLTIGTTLTKRWSTKGAPVLYGGLFAGNESSKDQSEGARSVADRSLYGIQVGGGYQYSDSVAIRLMALAQASDYTAPYLALPTMPKRSETLYYAELSLPWLVGENWKVTPTYTYSQNSSNIDMYNYVRNQYAVYVRRDF